MASSESVLLGFDPGGQSKFGWSVCHAQATDDLPKVAYSGVGDDAKDVLEQVTGTISTHFNGVAVAAAGIDAPLFWGERGNRDVDEHIDSFITKAGPRMVLKINSLFSACTVQGVLLGKYLSQQFPSIRITETHPTAVMELMTTRHPLQHQSWVAQLRNVGNRHEQDAIISAYCAWQMLIGADGWTDLAPREPNVVQPFGLGAQYWMPLA